MLFNDDDYEISDRGNNLTEAEDDSGAEFFEEEESEEAEQRTETATPLDEVEDGVRFESKQLDEPKVKASRRKNSNFEPVISDED